MFAEMHIQEILDNQKKGDSLDYTQLWKEVKVVFAEIDSGSNGWMLTPGNNGLDTTVVFTYFSRSALKPVRGQLLVSYLKQRLRADSALIHFYKTRP
jgi:hypothetical protein